MTQAEINAALGAMVNFAARNSPYYREQSWAKKLAEKKPITFADIPVTSKNVVRANAAMFHTKNVPPEDGSLIEKYTSGTTGQPLHVKHTRLHYAVNSQENSRLKAGWDHESQKRILKMKNAHGDEREGTLETEQGPGGRTKFTLYSLISAPAAAVMKQNKITMLTGYPSAVTGALLELDDFSNLELISTVGEIIPEALQAILQKRSHLRHFDSYGLIEIGMVAGRCAACGLYHIANRQNHLEILNADDSPVKPGERGRVVVTNLHNRAMPLLRYETGDIAELASHSRCAVSTVAIKRFFGRERDLFTLDDGTRVAPMIASEIIQRIGLKQFKLRQINTTEVEMFYIPANPAAILAEAVAQDTIDKNISRKLKVKLIKVDELPRTRGGKVLIYESLVPVT
jgi:phenylacetate-CoA ligase